LFLPSYLGGGFGHIRRCLSLAQALDEKGWQPAFALGGQHTSRVQAGGYPVFRLRRPFEPILDQGDGPAFTVFSDLGFQLLRDRLNSSSSIRAALAEQLAVLRRWKPGLLVSDSWLLADILGHLAGIPVVQVVRTATHPAVRQLIWWQEPPADLLAPDLLPLFNPMLMDLRVPPIEHAEDLLRGSLYLVPSIPELDPLPGDLPGTFYTGPLTHQKKANKSLPDWLEDSSSDRPIVYVTLGGGAGPVGGPEFYRLLFDALADLPIQVIASTGARLSPDDLVAAPPNFRIEAWVPGPELIKRSRLVVYPGGYGTTMELVESGVPGLVIPVPQRARIKRPETGSSRCWESPAAVWGPT
jgi:UDP:flavonoid glycosyltransferase YjiC (YdhE family)